MKIAEDIHRFILKLDKSERRRFRLFALRKGARGNARSLLLYDLLANMAVFDRDKYEASLHAANEAAHINSAHTRLMQLLVNSQMEGIAFPLTQSNLRQSPEVLKYLLRMEQIRLARQYLAKAMEMAAQIEEETILYDLLQFEGELFLAHPHTNHADFFEAYAANIAACQQRLMRLQKLALLNTRLRAWTQLRTHARTAEGRNWFQKLQENLPEMPVPNPENIRETLYYQNIRGLVAMVTGDYPAARGHFEMALSTWEKHSVFTEIFPAWHLGVQNNYITSLLYTEAPPEVYRQGAVALSQLSFKEKTHRIRQMRIVFNHSLNYALYFGDYSEGFGVTQKLGEWLENEGDMLELNRKITFHFNMAIFFFLHGHLKQANRKLMAVLNLPAGEERLDIRDFSRIFQIILHFELGNLDLAVSLLSSAERYLRRQKRFSAFHKLFSTGFRKIIREISGSPEQNHEFQGLLDALTGHYQKSNEKVPLGANLTALWAGSRSKKEQLLNWFRGAKVKLG